MKKWIWIGVSLAVIVGLGVMIAQRAAKVQEAREEQSKPVVLAPPAVEVQSASEHDFVTELEASGEVRAKRVVYVFAKVSGKVEELSAGLGDEVVRGQALAQVEENDLDWREKQGVANERAARAMVGQAAAQADVAKTEFERVERLFQAKVVPEADLTRARGKLKTARAALAAAQAQVQVARAGSGLAKEVRSWTVVEAPIDGVVTRRMTELGAMVGGQPPQPLFEIQDQSSLEIHVDVPARALDAVAIGTKVEFEVAERPGRRFEAEVKAVGKSLDPITRRVRIELTVPGEVVGQGVLPAMLATVFVKTGERLGVVAAPRAAVITLAGGPAVFVVAGGKAKKLTPDLAMGDRTHVPVEGLAAGDEVVVAGQDKLRDGIAVEITKRSDEGAQPVNGAPSDGQETAP